MQHAAERGEHSRLFQLVSSFFGVKVGNASPTDESPDYDLQRRCLSRVLYFFSMVDEMRVEGVVTDKDARRHFEHIFQFWWIGGLRVFSDVVEQLRTRDRDVGQEGQENFTAIPTRALWEGSINRLAAGFRVPVLERGRPANNPLHLTGPAHTEDD